MTVAVIDDNFQTDKRYTQREDHDFYIEWFSGTGKGGQHRNKHQNSCRYYHLPTGLVETRQGRSRENNLSDAKAALLQKLDLANNEHVHNIIAADRKTQIGSGMRGDKIRTYRFQDDTVNDHLTNQRSTCKLIMRGNFNLLWN